MLRNAILYGTASDRPTPEWHPPSLQTWREGADTFITWFLPNRLISPFPDTVILAFAFLGILSMIAILVYISKETFRTSPENGRSAVYHWYLLIGNMAGSFLLILVTVLFLDRLTPLNNRILLPTYLFLLILLLISAIRFAQIFDQRVIQMMLFSGSLLFTFVHVYRGIQTVRELRTNGLGLSSPQWHSSETMAYLRSLPEVPIFTNDIPAVYFHSDRMAHFIPTQQNFAKGREREDYQKDLVSMRARLKEGYGVLVLFGANPEERLHTAELEDLTLGLELVRNYPDSDVYRPLRHE
jgi:hypothetical protein